MRLRTILLAAALPIAAGSASAAVVVSSSSSGSSAATGGYPWAAVSCQTQTWTGPLTNGARGTVCQDDDWGPSQGVYYRAESSYGYRNCTDWVAWRFQQANPGMTLPTGMGDASHWGTYFMQHFTPPDNKPTVGSIAWEPGGDHVAYVEAVNPQSGTVLISEYNEQYRPGYLTWGTGVYDERPVAISHFEYLHVPGASGQSTTPSSVVSQRAPPTTTLLPFFTPEHTWSWTGGGSGGYTAAFTLQTGAISNLASAPVLPGFLSQQLIQQACPGLDAISDGIIPVEVHVVNTTPNFPATPGAQLFLNPYYDFFYRNLSVETTDSNGQCSTIPTVDGQDPNGGGEGNPWQIASSGDLPAGGSQDVWAYLIIKGYYTPDHPNGDPSVLANANLDVENPGLPWTAPGSPPPPRGVILLNGSTGEQCTSDSGVLLQEWCSSG